MVYKSVGIEGYLCGRSRNPYIGKEYKSFTQLIPNIETLWGENGDVVRFLYKVNKKSVSVIVVENIKTQPTITNMYTKKNFRRNKLAFMLFVKVLLLYPHVKFSENLSDDGKAFKNFVIK